MAENRNQQHDRSREPEKHIPSTDHENTAVPDRPSQTHEPRGIQKGIAEADKKARTGSAEEAVRNTPPAGAWNETSAD